MSPLTSKGRCSRQFIVNTIRGKCFTISLHCSNHWCPETVLSSASLGISFLGHWWSRGWRSQEQPSLKWPAVKMKLLGYTSFGRGREGDSWMGSYNIKPSLSAGLVRAWGGGHWKKGRAQRSCCPPSWLACLSSWRRQESQKGTEEVRILWWEEVVMAITF